MKFRKTIGVFLIVGIFMFGYIFGYFRATKNTEFMLSVNHAMLSMATLKYLKENELDKIQSIHVMDLEASVAGIKSAIEMDKFQINNFRTLYYYHKLYGIDKAGKEHISNNIFEKYEKYKQ